MPSIAVHNRQRAIKIDRAKLQSFAELALKLVAQLRGRKGVLAKLLRIDVILISDRRMSDLHRRFLRIAGPTDVITFQHGEIFVSADTARRQARAFGTSTIEEIRLYVAHGLLHLCGFEDKTAVGAREMREVQKRIVRAASEELAAGSPRTRGSASLRN